MSLAATVKTPHGPLVCYSCHFEVYCGMLSRMSQFADIMKDSKDQICKGNFHQVVLGDLNTMGHGIARLSPNFCCDYMRFWSLGWTEASYWDKNIIQECDPDFLPEHDSTRSPSAPPVGQRSCKNSRLERLGLDADTCRDILNPGFEDPFDPVKTITLDNAAYRIFGYSLMAGKFDWVLLRRCSVDSKAVGNNDYAASDHKWLAVNARLV